MKITIFSEELRKCLNAAGLSDCGENDTWNYWYQRLMNAYDESVERQIMTEQAENAKLRELVRDMFGAYKGTVEMLSSSYSKNVAERAVMDISDRMCELGVEI